MLKLHVPLAGEETLCQIAFLCTSNSLLDFKCRLAACIACVYGHDTCFKQ